MKKLLVGILALLFSFAVFAGTTDLDRLLLHERYGEDPWLGFGTMAGTTGIFTFEFDDADADAVCLVLDFPAGDDDINVPVLLAAISSSDYGYFTGIVEPTIAVENAAGTSWLAIDHTATTLARLYAGGAATYLTIATALAGSDIVLDAADAAANTAQQYVSITGTIPAHASGSPTDIFLDITPTVGINTGAANVHLLDLTFTTQAWATAVTSNFRGIYFAPTIGNASSGTNTVALIDVAAFTGDAQVSFYGLRAGILSGTAATENFIEIGSGWDLAINTASPITLTGTAGDLDAHDNITCGDLIIDEAAGVLDFSGTTSATISTSTGTCDLVLASADDADGSDKTYVEITGSVPAHTGSTPTSIFLDISPTVGIPTVANTVNLIDMTFTTPIYATAVTSTYRGIYFAPTIGAATLGTNAVTMLEIANYTGDADVNVTGIKIGTSDGLGTANAIEVGTGWDAGFTSASPMALTGDLDVNCAVISLDGSTSVDLLSAGYISIESDDIRLGLDVDDYVQFVTSADSANLAITHPGNTPAVTWTATSFNFTGTFEVDGFTASGLSDLDGGIAVDTSNFTVSGTTGTIVTAADIDVQGSDITNTTAGAGLHLEATAAVDGSDIDFVEITGSIVAHTGSTPTSRLLEINPTVGIPIVDNTVNLIDMVFTLPTYATNAATSTYRGIYFDPTIGAPTDGTNILALIDVAAIGDGDDDQDIYVLRIGALTGAAGTENAIDIGAGWDAGLTTASPIVISTAAGSLDFSGATSATISTSTGTCDIVLDSADEADGSDKTYVSITGTVPAHTGSTPTSIFLDISPTIGIPTVANDVNLIDMVFTTPVYATAVASTIRGLYFDPTIGAATLGTNNLVLFDVAAIGDGDADLNVYVMRVGAMTQEGGETANAIDIGAGWDAGLTTASPVIISTAVGSLDFSGATSATISTSTGTCDLVLDSADETDGSDKTYVEITGSVPIHTGSTPTSIFLDISPTIGIPTVVNTVNLIDMVFTVPDYATAVASTYRGIYFDPTLSNASAGTNVLALIDVAAMADGDADQDVYVLRVGAMTQEGAETADAIDIGTGWDYGLDSDSPVKALSLVLDDGDADLTVDSDDQTNASAAASVPDFADATADFLMTNLFTVILPFAGGQAGEDTDAAGTNGGGMVGSTVDVTTHDFNSSGAGADDVLCKVYDHTSTTWDDLSQSATLSGGADWTNNYQLLPDQDAEETNDAFAVGFDEQFCMVVFNDLATNNGALATWGGAGGQWEYSTSTDNWTALTVHDNTDSVDQTGGQPLVRTGAITFVPPAAWGTATYDGETAYWIQFRITAAQLTQTPIIDDTNYDEPIVGIPTTDTFTTPFKMSLAEVRVTNNGPIHNQNIEFIVGNFTDGTFSAVCTWTASQWTDWFDLAAEIACDPGDLIGIMITDDNGAGANPFWMAEFVVTYED